MSIDMYIICLYLVMLLLIGIVSSRKVKTIKDFSVSNHTYPTFVIFATLSCSLIGGGFSFGNSSKVYENGIGNIFILFGFSIGQILIGKYIAPKIEKFRGCISVGDIMGKSYGSFAQIITGVVSFVLCAGILGAQIGTIGIVFNTFFNIPQTIGTIIGALVILIYSTLGGIKADIITDVVQFFILIIGMPILVIFATREGGGITNILNNTPSEYFNIFNNIGIISFISMFLTLMLGEMLMPPYIQRLLIGRDAKSVSTATISSGILSIPFFILTGYIGIVGINILPGIESNILMAEVIKKALPIGLSGVVISSMMSIVLSTADSYLNSASVSFVNDIYMKINIRRIDENKKLRMARLANVLTGLIAVIVSISIPSIFDILVFTYMFWAPVVLIPLVMAMLGIKLSIKQLLSGILAGIIGTIIGVIYISNTLWISPVICGVISHLITTYLFRNNKHKQIKWNKVI